MGKSAKMPAAPDYVGAANATAAGNLEAARAAAAANRVNQYTPYGNLTYSHGSQQYNDTAYNNAMADYQAKLDAYNSSGTSGVNSGDYASMLNALQNSSGTSGVNSVDYASMFNALQNGSVESENGLYGGSQNGSVELENGLYRGSQNGSSSTPKVKPVMPNREDYLISSPDDGWSVTTTLAPEQQQLLDQQNAISLGLANLADRGLGYVDSALKNNITLGDLPKSMVNPGQTGQDALMARFQPQIERSRAALENKLANQGIMPGSEAYKNAMEQQQQGENDLWMQAALNGINVGQNAQNQQMQLLTALQNQPVNMLNAVRSGSQVTNPTFGSVPQQATTAGPDLLGAANMQANYNQGVYNAKTAQNNSLLGGIGSLGAAAIQGLLSDVRLKSNIRRIGTHDKLGIGIYSYMKFGQPEIGVIAQELEMVCPEAVAEHPSGYKMVDIGVL